MKKINLVCMLATMSASMLASQTSFAQSDANSADWPKAAWYIGAGIGQSRSNIDQQRIVNSLINNGATNVSFSRDERDLAYKLFLGKNLGDYFSWELGYFDLGKSTFSASADQAVLNGSVKFQGGNLDLLGRLPVSDSFALYAKIGAQYAQAKASFTGNRLYAVTSPMLSESKFNPKLGIGLEFKLNDEFSLRTEMERYRLNDGVGNRGDVDMYSLNLVYRMGKPAQPSAKPSRMPESIPTPMAEVQTPTPAPVVPAAPMPTPMKKPVAVSEKMTFSAEALFDFDKSVVKSDGKLALDQMLSNIRNMNTEVMVTVGHTDSIGSKDYNQALSLRRAQAVKDYLVTQGVSKDRVYIEGKGESQPIADNSTAQGRAKNRRVVVEVVGSKP